MANTDKRVDELSNLSSLTGDELVLLQNPTTLEYGKTTLANVSAKSPVTSVAGKTGAVSLTKDDVGLSNAENTADVNKPISSATQAALNSKEGTINPGNTGQYFRGDKTWQTLDKSAVGLGNVDNTSDLNKPISTATQTALNGKVSLKNVEDIPGEKTFLSNINLKSTSLSFTPTGTFMSPTLANQGLASDGTYIYVAPDHSKIEKRLASDGTLVSSITISEKVGGLYYYDGKIYTGGGTFSFPFTAFISVVDASTMALLNTYNVTPYANYGLDAIVVVDDIIYTGETAFGTNAVKSWYTFNLDGTYRQKVYSEETVGGKNDWQDATYYGGYIIATDHTGIVNIFDGVGTDQLVRIGSSTYPGHKYFEGITNVGNSFYLYDSITQSLLIANGLLGTNSRGYLSSSGTLVLTDTSGLEKVNINPSGSSHIDGGLAINGTVRTANEALKIYQTVDNNAGGIIQTSTGATTFRTWVSSNSVANMQNGGSAGGVIALNGSGTGSVGIGTTSPAARLDVNGTLRVAGTISNVSTPTATNDATTKAYVDTADALKVNKAGDTMTGALNTTDVRPTSASTYNLGQTTNRYFHVFTERIRLGNTELSMLSGTGFPEGVVTANVGSIYIDTAVTNGASSWIKKSGTGNTGWQVLEGDTGSRNISASISGTYYSGGSQARLSRVNGTVFLAMDVVTIAGYTTTAVLTLPLGFAGIPSYISPGYAGTAWFGTAGTSISLNFAGANAGLRGAWSWRATDAWPTTLPGTAA